jgi:hypothetical protein
LNAPPPPSTPKKNPGYATGQRFGTWNVRSLYRAGSIIAAARELARYKLDLVGVQKVRWDKYGSVKAGEYSCFYGKGNENHQLQTEFFFVQPIDLITHTIVG